LFPHNLEFQAERYIVTVYQDIFKVLIRQSYMIAIISIIYRNHRLESIID